MPIPPDTRARGQTGHIGDHNAISDVLTTLTAAVAAAGTFAQPFTAAASVTVTHGLGRYPSVTVVDTAGDEVDGDITYLTADSLTVTFSAPTSGDIYCNLGERAGA